MPTETTNALRMFFTNRKHRRRKYHEKERWL